MRNKNLWAFGLNFIYINLIIAILVFGCYLAEYYRAMIPEIAPVIYLIYISLFPVFIGLLLGLPKFITFYKTKKLKLNSLKLASIGLPTLYVTALPLLKFTPISKFLFLKSIFLHFSFVHDLCGVILGFIILDSFTYTDEPTDLGDFGRKNCK